MSHPTPSIPDSDITMSSPTALQSYLDALILLWRTADPLASAADTLSPPHSVPKWHKKARIVVQVEALNFLGLLWHGPSPPCSAKLHFLQLILAVAAERGLYFWLFVFTWSTPEGLQGSPLVAQPLWTPWTPPTNTSQTFHSPLMLLLLCYNTVMSQCAPW